MSIFTRQKLSACALAITLILPITTFGAIAPAEAVATVDFVEATSAGKEQWNAIASSTDGKKLVAVSRYMMDDSDLGTVLGSIFTSTDSGVTWTKSTSAGLGIWSDVASSSDGTKLAAVTESSYTTGNGGVFTSSDSGATWTLQTGASAGSWIKIASSGDGAKLVASKLDGSVFTSTDSGVNWAQQSVPGSGSLLDITSSSDGTKLAAVRGDGNVYTSTDSGFTWKENAVADGIRTTSISSSSDGTRLVTAAAPGPSLSTFVNIFTSSDSGATWTEQTGSGQRRWSSVSTSSDGTKIIAGTWMSGGLVPGVIYTSTDSGVTWVEQSSAGLGFWSTVVISGDGTTMAAGDVLGNGTNGRLVTYTGELPSGPTDGAPAPTVSNVSPQFGPASGGTLLTITGTGFAAGATVKLGDKSCLDVVVVSDTSITCSTPAGAASGFLTISVTNSDTQSANKYGAFYYALPQIELDEPVVDDTFAKSTSATETVTATNNGKVDLVFGANAVSLEGTNTSDFSIVADNCSGKTIAPDATCTVDFKFTPQALGARSARLVFVSNASNNPNSTPLSGNSLDAVQTSQPYVPNTTVNTTSPIQSETITNLGDVDLVFGANAVTLTGASASDFSIVSDNCSNTTVAADASCNVTYTFSPRVAGLASADLVFTSSSASSPNVVMLAGTGLDAKGLIATTPVFEKTYVTSSSPTKTVTVTNKSASKVVLGDDAVAIPSTPGTDYESFAIIADGCSNHTLVANGTCAVKVRFSPKTKGAHNAKLTIKSDAAGSPNNVKLTGVGMGNISISKFGKTSGPVSGGSTFNIIGSGFDSKCIVKFGSKPVVIVKRIGSVNIKIRTVAHKAGKVSIMVMNPDGGFDIIGSYTFK